MANSTEHCLVCFNVDSFRDCNSYGARVCSPCASFFRETMLESKNYECLKSNNCNTSFEYRSQFPLSSCKSCRFQKCLEIGMKFKQILEKKFKCEECSKSYDEQKQLKYHIRSTHANKFPCTVDGCTREFTTKQHRDRHSNLTNPNYHNPEKNPRNYSRESRNQQGRFECVECSSKNQVEKLFTTGQALKEHQDSIHGEVRYQCKVPGCKKSFKNRSACIMHSRNPNPQLHDPKRYDDKKLEKKRTQDRLKKVMKIPTSFSGKANGKPIDEEYSQNNSSSIDLETIEGSNNGIFTKKTFLLSNSYINQYLFAAKKMSDSGRSKKKEKRNLWSRTNVEGGMLYQQRELKYQKFWEKIDLTKMEKECQRLLSLGKAAMCDSGVEAMEASTSIQQATPSTDPSLLENIAFKPVTNCNVNGVELPEVWLWKAIHLALTDPAFLLNEMKFPLREVIQQLKWQVSPAHGVYEIFKSEVLVMKKKLRKVYGFYCENCKEYGSLSLCRTCSSGVLPKRFQPSRSVLPLWEKEAPRKNSTLVFLVARLSGIKEPLKYSVIFKDIRASIEQSAENPGPFNGFNFPGAPQPIIFMENFMSCASATTAIDRMFQRTSNPDILPLHMLAEYIIFHYYPGNTITIGMTQPGSFTVSPQYMKQFIVGLFSRGIPKDSLFFYCHCLKSTWRKSIKLETIVKANDLLKLINKNSPTYGTRPAAVAYLHSMLVECRKRDDLPGQGRNDADLTIYHSESQKARKKLVYADLAGQICNASDCNVVLGRNFSIKCGDCSRWYHGKCVGLQRQHARVLEEKRLKLSCNFCLEKEEVLHSSSSQPSTQDFEDVDMENVSNVSG